MNFTLLNDLGFWKYIVAHQQKLLPMVPRIVVMDGFMCKMEHYVYYCSSKCTIANHHLVYFCRLRIDQVCGDCQVQHLVFKVGQTMFFDIDR
jgi:hypothetical protein